MTNTASSNGSNLRRIPSSYAAVLASSPPRRLDGSSGASVLAPSPPLVGSMPSRQVFYSDLEEDRVVLPCPEYLESTAYAETEDMPFPTAWSDKDKMSTIDIIGDGRELKYIGPSKGAEQDAASVRSDFPMPKGCGIFYYEIEILSKGKDGYIGFGFCKNNVHLNKLPGWEADSWGYHGDDGHSFCCQGTGKPYGPQFSTGDVVGCAVNFRNGTASYTKNGVDLGVAFRDLKGTLFPAVGLRTAGEHVRVNFGQQPFVFDIEHYMREEKTRTYEEINSNLLSDTVASHDAVLAQTIQSLVASYLAHDGFIASSRAFANDVEDEKQVFGEQMSIDSKEESEALQRQRIRRAVLDGNIEKAIKFTNTFYPNVLRDNPKIHFRLRCRHFIELMRQCADTLTSETLGQSDDILVIPMKNGHHSDRFDKSVDIEMGDGDAANGGDAINGHGRDMKGLLTTALEYGQSLQEDYREDKSPEIQNALQEAFSLLAYTDPRKSIVSYLLSETGREPVAEELNSAILVSVGKSSVAPLERVVQHSTLMIRELADFGVGNSAFINIKRDFLT